MTKKINLTEAEKKLASLVWQSAPLSSPDLVALAVKQLNWKKSTTYTVLKKLCNKGICKNENTNISVTLSQEQLMAYQSRCYVEDTFGGSLPKFVASFFKGKKLTADEVMELHRLIDEYKEGE